MNRAYQELLAGAAAQNPSAVRKIRAPQQAWKAYCDAQTEAMFSAEDQQAEYRYVRGK
jgi:uncharacterized protein YecT (DUF1311 family)